MKRGATEHPKFKRLAKALGVPVYSAIGIMECLAHWTAKYAQRGDIGRYANDEISAGVGWDGDHDVLIQCLVLSGFVDECEEHRLVVHDWAQHADDATKKRLERSGEAFAVLRRTTADNGGQRRTTAAATADNGSLPEPEPEPEPESSQNQAAADAASVPASPRKVKPGGETDFDSLPWPTAHAGYTPLRDAWTDWVSERRERGKKMTRRAAELQVKTLSKFTPTEAVASIQASIANGWVGLFEPGKSGHGSSNPNREKSIAEIFREHQGLEIIG